MSVAWGVVTLYVVGVVVYVLLLWRRARSRR